MSNKEMGDTNLESRRFGIDAVFLQALAEAAEKNGYIASEVREERCVKQLDDGQAKVSDEGLFYSGAVLCRFVPKDLPRQVLL